MKVHVGCGAVLLKDWLNVDIPLPHVFLAAERPDLVERFLTTEEDYYGRHRDKTVESLRDGPVTTETACDAFGSFVLIPAKPGSVSELLSRQAFEHLDRHEAHAAIESCFHALKIGGILRIDIPDADETMRRYRETGDEFCIRHLFGPRRDIYGSHTHYTREMLKDLVESHGFRLEREEINIHFYPAYCLRFLKI